MQEGKGAIVLPRGFRANGIHAGIKADQKDMALIVSEKPAHAAAVFTKNAVKAAPVHVSKAHLCDGQLSAIIINSGNANACAPAGMENAQRMCALVAAELGILEEDVAVASTGVIGVSLSEKMDCIAAGVQTLVATCSAEQAAGEAAAEAIMTTDLSRKECARSLEIGGETTHIGAMAKGSGMIHPNMGTMLGFITTDLAISKDLLQKALRHAVDQSFNRVSVDGDTSTNDACFILANGMAGNDEICEENADYEAFQVALTEICVTLARAIAADGEGATHLITCTMTHAPSEAEATQMARAVIASSLVKSAVFGKDANWGRILCAMGYAGVSFDPSLVRIAFSSEVGAVCVCERGQGLSFDEAAAEAVLGAHEIEIQIDLQAGQAESTCWGCDLTYDYVKINGDYRT